MERQQSNKKAKKQNNKLFPLTN